MRGLLWLLTLFALAAGVSLAAHFNDGYLLLVLPPYRAEISRNLAILLVLLAFAMLYALLRAAALTLSLPRRVRASASVANARNRSLPLAKASGCTSPDRCAKRRTRRERCAGRGRGRNSRPCWRQKPSGSQGTRACGKRDRCVLRSALISGLPKGRAPGLREAPRQRGCKNTLMPTAKTQKTKG